MTSTANADGWPLRKVSCKKARRAVTPQMPRAPDPPPMPAKANIDEAMNVIGPAVQKNDRRAIGGTCFSIGDVQRTGIDLHQRTHASVPGWIVGNFVLAGCALAEDCMPSWAAAAVMAGCAPESDDWDRRPARF